MEEALRRHTFEAMGTSLELLLDAESTPASATALALAETEIRRLEGVFSRFRPDSELTALNEAGSMTVGPELLEVTDFALAARERTGGRFDPTVHDALVAAGYDRTLDDVPPDMVAEEPTEGTLCGGGVRIDHAESRIELDPGVRLDFGGIAKGFAAERTCDVLAEAGNCLVNAGGDVSVRGRLDGAAWPVGVETPEGIVTLGLESGSLATTGRDRRRWLRNGREHHHVIDPATGMPSESDLLRVTVVAPCAMEAEVLAKSLFLGGEQGALREADELGIPSLLVTRDGRVVFAGGLE